MGSKYLHQIFSLENQSKACWTILGSSQQKDLLWKEVCTQGCFPFPLWIVPSLSQLERGHLELKRPTDTCVKCILPLAVEMIGALRKFSLPGVMGQSESHLQSCSSCSTDTFPAKPLPIMAPVLWDTGISTVHIGQGNEISFLHNLGHTSILKLNAEKKGFPLWFLVSTWGELFLFSPLSCG